MELHEISVMLQAGKAKVVKQLVQQAIDEGISVEAILKEGLMDGMSVIGEKFKNNEVFVPEVLVAARAMNMGAALLKPLLAESGAKTMGKVCIGTVQGDLHDIGKNLVRMMLEGKGIEVIDLGTDVAPEKFIEAAIENDCQIICISALLTTTMSVMEDVVKVAEAAGIRDKVKIMIGGAPITQDYCDQIGADAYSEDAAEASDIAARFCMEKRERSMHTDFLWNAASAAPKMAISFLSFPAATKLGVNVDELVHSAELQAKAMEYVAHNTPTAASVSLMDLSVEAEAFGAQVRFGEWEVPNVIGRLVEDEDGAEALEIPEIGAGRTGICIKAIEKAKSFIKDKPVLAGVIGPYSLAGRLMDVTEIMYACYDDPDVVHTLLGKCTEFLISYCEALRSAGADGIVMAEPLAGLLNADMVNEFSCKYVKNILDAIQTEDFPVVYHNCGNAVTSMLPQLFEMKAAAYHFGNAVDMTYIMKNAPANALCMGNISPAGRFAAGTAAEMKQAVKALMDGCATYPNFIPSSGCDIPAGANWNNIAAFFEAVAEYEVQ